MSRPSPTADNEVPGRLSTGEKKLICRHLGEFRVAQKKSDCTQIVLEAYLELGQTLASQKVSEIDLSTKLYP
jgi:hypothetical protein